jgi:hypothetical protein
VNIEIRRSAGRRMLIFSRFVSNLVSKVRGGCRPFVNF